MISHQQQYRLRMALARHAHDSDTIRLHNPDLRGFDHLVASRQGLFAVRPGERRLVAHGQYYGITVHDDAIFAFEACDQPRIRTYRGRLLRLRLSAGQIDRTDVVAKGLDNGCHQIDAINGQLYLTDTYNQRLLRLRLDGSAMETLQPLPMPDGQTGAGYVHANSLLACGDAIYLLQHNDGVKTGMTSSIAVFDRQWRRTGTIPLAGIGCHNLAMLEDGHLISCGSLAGEIIGADGMAIKICDRMTRGLSVDAHGMVVGGSALLNRNERDSAPGEVYFLDRQYRQWGSVPIPGAVMEIRRIDGQDRSLSSYLG